MNILDKKGRLFGIINIIDLIVLVLIIGVLIFGFSRSRDGGIVTQGETKEGIITYEISDIRQMTVDQMIVGDPIYHYDKGTYIGVIDSVEIRPFVEKIDYRGEWIEAEVPNRYVAELNVRADIEENDQFYSAGGEQTRVGTQYRLKNKNFASFGFCINIDIVE